MKLFKKVLAMALSLAMVMGMSVSAWADDAASPVAQVGGTNYSTLQLAIDAATEGQTVTLLRSTTEDKVEVKSDDNVIIDFGGYTVTGAFIVHGIATFNNGIIVNTSVVSGIELNNNETGASASAAMTLNNMTVTSNRHAIRIDGGTAVINSGTYTCTAASSVSGYAVNIGGSHKTTVTINGGTFFPSEDASTQGTAVMMKNELCDVTINGGTFNSAEIYSLESYGDLKVTGGTFETGAVLDKDSTSISGGSYGFDVSNYMSEDCVAVVGTMSAGSITSMSVATAEEAAKNAVVVTDAEGNKTYFSSLEVAEKYAESITTEGAEPPKVETPKEDEPTTPPVVTTPTEPSWTWDDEEEEEEIRYDVEEGKNQKYTQNSEEGLTFKFDASFRKFKSIRVDGKKVASKYYTAEKGSTIITLSPEYLDTLDSGKHTLKVLFSDGYAQVKFTVLEGAKVEASAPAADADKLNPSTGANDFVGAAVAMAVVSVAGVALLNKKR